MVPEPEANYLRRECSSGLRQVEVGIIGIQVPSPQYKSILCCGRPRNLVGGIQHRFSAILPDIFAAVDFTYNKTEPTESDVAVILVWIEVSV